MGRPTLGLAVIHVNKDEMFKHDLYAIADHDEDMNGNNGEEYTRAVALNNGYKSTIEWAVEESIKKHENDDDLSRGENIIKSVILKTYGSDGYYEQLEFEITEVSEGWIVSIAYTH